MIRIFLVSSAAALAALPVERVTLGSARIQLGETTFAEVAAKLGSAPVGHTGDAGASRYQACYQTAGARPTTYYLESGEMGAGERVIQFEAIAPGARSVFPDSVIAPSCGKLAPATGAGRTDRGVVLGLTRAEVQRRLGGPGKDSAGFIMYEKSEVRRTKDYRATAWSLLRIRYANGRVVAFAAVSNLTD